MKTLRKKRIELTLYFLTDPFAIVGYLLFGTLIHMTTYSPSIEMLLLTALGAAAVGGIQIYRVFRVWKN